MDRQVDDFTAFVADCEQQLRGTALLLTGDPATADDLVVAALARTHRRWRRLDSPADALADARGTLVAAATGRTRLPAADTSTGVVHGPDDDRLDPGDRRWLEALADLDPTVRAVVVLRLVEGQDEESVATLLGCAPLEVADALTTAVQTLGALLAEEPAPELQPAPQPHAQPVAPVPALPGTWAAGDLDAVFRRPDASGPRPVPTDQPAPAPQSAGATPAHPTPDGPAPAGPAPAGAAPAGPAPVGAAPAGTAPAGETPPGDDDPWAIYRRPT